MTGQHDNATEREGRLHQILLAYLKAMEKGQRPDRQELLNSHAEFATELAEFFASHDQVDEWAAPLLSVGQAVSVLTPPPEETPSFGKGDCPSGDGSQAPAKAGTFGDYELLEEIGQGGMGVVYKARQKSLNRLVALKMIRAGSLARRADVQRFRAEAEAVASLDHPHIVPIYEVGELEGQPYFTMKLMSGRRLAESGVRSQGSAVSKETCRRAAELVATVARAVHHAHQRGVLHRDLKPSNILLDAEGRPHVTDFGLAKRLELDSSLTQSGLLVGTPSYMAPEQATAQRGAITTATDIHGLGAVLYVLLTGRPPFRGDSVLDTLEQVKQREPEPPSASNRQVDRDLETICLKCLQKEPRDRYASALALAEDLERYLAGAPIRGRRVTARQRVILWAKRRPAQAAMLLASGVAALALVGVGVAVFYNTKLTAALEEARFHQHFHYLARANTGWLSENMAQVEKLLDACAVDRRGWEWHYLKRLCHADLLTIKGHTGNVSGVAFSPDGMRLASCSFDGTVKLWDAATGREINTLTGHTNMVHRVAFSPDGTRLASAGGDRTVRVWDAMTGNAIHTIPAHEGIVLSVAFSPDGSRLASTSYDGTVKVWDAATGRPIATLREHTGVVSGVAFSPDGIRLASTGYRGGLILWDAKTHKVLHKIPSHAGGFLDVAFSPDGTRIAPASSDGTVKVWDATTGQLVLTCTGHSSSIYSVAFNPDGTRLASACMDGTVKVWDVTTGQLTFTYLGHTSEARNVAFSPDGTRLASASSDQTVKVWDATTDGPGPRTFPRHAGDLLTLAFSPDGTRLASAGLSGMVEVCDVTTGQELLTLPSSANEWVWGVAFSPNGTRLASTGPGGTVWDARTGHELFRLRGHNDKVTGVGFSRDGTRIASGAWDGTVKVWDARTGELLHNLEGHTDSVRGVAFSPDGTRLASASNDRTVRVWDAATGRPIHTLTGHTHFVHGVAFSPDGTRVASAGHDTTVKVWDVITGEEVPQLLAGHTSAVLCVAFSPDGTRIASGAWDGTVKVWDAATGEEALTLKGHRDEVRSVAFSPDGALLASAGRDRTVKIWDARPWTPAAAIEREALGLLACLFAKPLCRSDVIDNLRLPMVSPPAREMALGLVERYKEETDPERYHQASWAILRQPYLNAFQYGFALRQAETVCRLAPENREYRIALGVAHYRAGQLRGALDTLKRANQRDSGRPAILAFLAMAQHRLALYDQARATLEHLRQTMQQAEWLMNAEACAFVREAEAVLKAATPTKNEGI